MKQRSTPGRLVAHPARLALAATALMASIATGASAQTSAQFTTRTLNIVNLRNPTEEVRISPNLLTKLYFADDVIEEIKSGNPNLFTMEINEAGNEISLRSAAKAGFTDLYVKTTSGIEASFLLKVVTDAQGGPRQLVINSPSLLTGVVQTPQAPLPRSSGLSTSPLSIPSVPAVSTPVQTQVLRAPANIAAAPAVASAPVAPAPARSAPVVNRLTNPITVAADTSEPVDYRTQAIVDKSGVLTMYYEIRNISNRTLTVDPQNLTVTVAGRKVDYQLLRNAGVNRITLKPGANEVGAVMLASGTAAASVDVSWIVTDDSASYTYARSFNAKEMQQP